MSGDYEILGGTVLGADDDKVFHDKATVGSVQRKLIKDGVALPRYGADENYGNETRDAILFWRRAHGPGYEGDGEIRASLLRLMGIPVPGEKGFLSRAVDWVYEKAVGPSTPATPALPTPQTTAAPYVPAATLTPTAAPPAPGTPYLRPQLSRDQK